MKKRSEEMAKDMPPAEKKQFDDMMRQLGGPDYKDQGKPIAADLSNRLKSAELLLDQFKKNTEVRDRLGWTKEEEEQWIKDQEAAIEAMRKQSEKSDFRIDRGARSPIAGGPAGIKLDPKDTGDARQQGRYAPPSGYVDPYKRFTGGGRPAEPKR
jgi:hypothetical protein